MVGRIISDILDVLRDLHVNIVAGGGGRGNRYEVLVAGGHHRLDLPVVSAETPISSTFTAVSTDLLFSVLFI